MNVLFLTLSSFNSINERGIYYDLMRKIMREGHSVYVVSPIERRYNKKTKLIVEGNCHILRVKTLNIQKTNIIEKGIGTILIENQFKKAIKKLLKNTSFDLVLYSTPPITLNNLVTYLKKRDNSTTYLMLKDIFPQNAVDLGMIRKNGLFHRFFRNKERKLYRISDYIGCMSPANVNYILFNNPEINKSKVEVCPNSIELPIKDLSINKKMNKERFINKYNIPDNAAIIIYGGNLGKPQGIEFLLDILKSNCNKTDRFFIIAGTGTEFPKINKEFNRKRFSNALLLSGLPKNEYDQLLEFCDIGIILLDARFTIPNYPSRLLSYLEYKIPVLCATDSSTDIGRIAEENGYGLSSISGDINSFNKNLEKLIKSKELLVEMGDNGYKYLIDNYLVEKSYSIIFKHIN